MSNIPTTTQDWLNPNNPHNISAENTEAVFNDAAEKVGGILGAAIKEIGIQAVDANAFIEAAITKAKEFIEKV